MELSSILGQPLSPFVLAELRRSASATGSSARRVYRYRDLPGRATSATTLEHVAYYTMDPSARERDASDMI